MSNIDDDVIRRDPTPEGIAAEVVRFSGEDGMPAKEVATTVMAIKLSHDAGVLARYVVRYATVDELVRLVVSAVPAMRLLRVLERLDIGDDEPLAVAISSREPWIAGLLALHASIRRMMQAAEAITMDALVSHYSQK